MEYSIAQWNHVRVGVTIDRWRAEQIVVGGCPCRAGGRSPLQGHQRPRCSPLATPCYTEFPHEWPRLTRMVDDEHAAEVKSAVKQFCRQCSALMRSYCSWLIFSSAILEHTPRTPRMSVDNLSTIATFRVSDDAHSSSWLSDGISAVARIVRCCRSCAAPAPSLGDRLRRSWQ